MTGTTTDLTKSTSSYTRGPHSHLSGRTGVLEPLIKEKVRGRRALSVIQHLLELPPRDELDALVVALEPQVVCR